MWYARCSLTNNQRNFHLLNLCTIFIIMKSKIALVVQVGMLHTCLTQNTQEIRFLIFLILKSYHFITIYLHSFYLLIWKFNLLCYISSFGFHFNQDKITQINYFIQYFHAAAAAKLIQSCLTLCDPKDGSPPGSPVPGILMVRTLEWVAISFSNV